MKVMFCHDEHKSTVQHNKIECKHTKLHTPVIIVIFNSEHTCGVIKSACPSESSSVIDFIISEKRTQNMKG